MKEITFEQFLEINFKKTDKNSYQVLDPSDNKYRHYGLKKDKKLYLSLREAMHLYNPFFPLSNYPYFNSYFEIKNNGYNIIRHNRNPPDEYVYIKKSDFVRDREISIGCLKYVRKDCLFFSPTEPQILCVVGDETYAFLKVDPVKELSFELDKKLFKKHADCK